MLTVSSGCLLGAETSQGEIHTLFSNSFSVLYHFFGIGIREGRAPRTQAIYIIDVSSDKFKAFAANKSRRIGFLGSGLWEVTASAEVS